LGGKRGVIGKMRGPNKKEEVCERGEDFKGGNLANCSQSIKLWGEGTRRKSSLKETEPLPQVGGGVFWI